MGQLIAFEHEGSNFKLTVGNVMIDVDGQSQDVQRAYLADNTAFIFTNSGQNPIKVRLAAPDATAPLAGSGGGCRGSKVREAGWATPQPEGKLCAPHSDHLSVARCALPRSCLLLPAPQVTGQKGYASTQLFKSKTLNFEQLGIGGLDKQFEAIFRRAFASRVFPPSILQKLGIKHVKGILLFGPPGTGKTLIARQIGKMLNGKEPKVVNGPEVSAARPRALPDARLPGCLAAPGRLCCQRSPAQPDTTTTSPLS